MLVKANYKNEKMLFSLLSYTLNQDKEEKLRDVLTDYRDQDFQDLFLYQPEGEDNYIALMGVEYLRDEADQALSALRINRLAVIPSFDFDQVGLRMYQALRQKYPNLAVISSIETAEYVSKWASLYQEEGEQ